MTSAVARALPGVATVKEVVVAMGRAEAILLDFMRTARGGFVQELHYFASPEFQQALLTMSQDGLHPRVLASRSLRFAADTPTKLGQELGVVMSLKQIDLRHYPQGSGDFYQHSKLVARLESTTDAASTALFTNASPRGDGPVRRDVAITLGGDSARGVYELLDASIDADPIRMRAAIQDAASAGVLVNEPTVGALGLTHAMMSMVRNAEHRIVHVSKGIDDPAFATALGEAKARGVQVVAVEREVSRSSGEILERMSVPTAVKPAASSRVNALIADDRALVSTAYPWDTMLGRKPGAGSRDSGVVLAGEDLASLERQLLDSPEGRGAALLAKMPPPATVTDAIRGSAGLRHEGLITLTRALREQRLPEHLT